jgi:hypothetical protein
VDARGVFTYVHVGYPGSVGDARTYSDTKFLKNVVDGLWLPQSAAREIRGILIRPYIVGDAAFPFSEILMKGFPGQPAPRTLEHAYNYCHVRTRRVVENAFGKLKGRFHVLKRNLMSDPIFLKDITLVCCAINNICARYNDPFEDTWFTAAESSIQIPGGTENAVSGNSNSAGAVRKALALHVRALGIY